jgi:hypothetical protein
MVETMFIPTSTERIAVLVLSESREHAEQPALSTDERGIRCSWSDGSQNDLRNVGAAVAWKKGTKWTALKYRLGCNKEVFDAEMFGLLRAAIMIVDQIEDMISEGVQLLIIFIDSEPVLNQI